MIRTGFLTYVVSPIHLLLAGTHRRNGDGVPIIRIAKAASIDKLEVTIVFNSINFEFEKFLLNVCVTSSRLFLEKIFTFNEISQINVKYKYFVILI